ncbi:hypothetical protein NMG60_11007864 [Bertholletia excelsa]
MPNMEREEGVVVVGRAEIDTRAPFRSVKEAVILFGERVLAGEVYASKLKEVQVRTSEHGQFHSRFGAVSAELKETKQILVKAQEEGNLMADCLKSLQQELEQTRRELQQLKTRREPSQDDPPADPEIEELKFIENSSKLQVQTKKEEGTQYLQKKRSVKFASPPTLAQVITGKDAGEVPEMVPSPRKQMKRKPLIPLIGGLFSKKKEKESQQAKPVRTKGP